ncbi:MAG: AgmX/PglI C-terminal domain-containing protein [Deltaproteobacteria bacterium]|nr:AgmX/PglI C-terminal domain-containing protein [Deltaproteobacteria bacterium]MCW5805116.1 AgmX/PglI C-terminal domain-containing protein [Deltaproteobacteria bacterium]
MTKLTLFAVAAASLAAACKTGSPQQRTDIANAMATTRDGLNGCYEMALARNRRTPGGFVTVEFVAEAQTGRFKNVLIRRDEVNDPAVRMCVIQAVGSLKMAKPPDSNVTIAYAFRFTATD